MAIREWMLGGTLALMVGLGAGGSYLLGLSEPVVEEELELGNLTLTELHSNLYSLTGDVGNGDCERIVPQLPTTEPFTVILESPGGSLQDGMCIAAHLKIRNVITVIRDTPVLNEDGEILYQPGTYTEQGVALTEQEGTPYTFCASACSLMFLGGDERYLIGDVWLGIHSPRSQSPGGGAAAAEAGAYATAAQLLTFLEDTLKVESAELQRFFITIPANDMYYLNPEHFAQAPWLPHLATHYYDFHGLSAVNPYASVLAAAQAQAEELEILEGGNK